jgi:thiamine-phosphate pyrophosphorylase
VNLPKLYPILDAGLLRSAELSLEGFARELRSAGVTFLQYRDKSGSDDEVLAAATLLRSIFPRGEATLILNDRVHLCAASGFDGVHIGQDDMPAARARALLGPEYVLGLSTHNPEQVRLADGAPVDYVAIGPVYATSSKTGSKTGSKENPDPVVGLEGVTDARRLTAKPLVAIGGITRETMGAVLEAGADAVAMISALLPREDRSTVEVAQDILVNFR